MLATPIARHVILVCDHSHLANGHTNFENDTLPMLIITQNFLSSLDLKKKAKKNSLFL